MATAAGMSRTSDAQEVLDQHRFDEKRLEDYLTRSIPVFEPPLHVQQFQGGMSNPTFMLTDGNGKRYVMRKKPKGDLLPSAHAVDREYRVISALWDSEVPVAKPHVLCQDPGVIGQDFYVMDHCDGRVYRDLRLPDQTPEQRRACYDSMNDVLAKLHMVDWRARGLEDYGREGGYIARQVKRWSKQYEASKTDDVPEMERLPVWLSDNMPDDTETTIVHGDYRLENTIYHPSEPRIMAVIDWELGTLGNPLSDLAYNCLPYHMSDANRGDLIERDPASGIPSEDEYVAAYCKRTGRGEIPNWNYYVVLSLFRLAAIAQGVYKRGLMGNASSPEALKRGDRAKVMSQIAWRLVQNS